MKRPSEDTVLAAAWKLWRAALGEVKPAMALILHVSLQNWRISISFVSAACLWYLLQQPSQADTAIPLR